MSQMVQIYHPALSETQLPSGKPKLVALQSVDDWAARGWLLVDPGVTPPPPSTPYYTRAELLSQIQGGGSPIGTALKGAFRSTAVEDLADDDSDLTAAVGAATAARYASHGEAAQMVQAALPNLMTAIRGYDDLAAPALRLIGFGSSVGVGATLPDPNTQTPIARFAARLDATLNLLDNLNLATANASVNGSIVTDFLNTAYAAGKTAAGGPPTVALLCYGMNDGMSGQYHTGQTLPGLYLAMRQAILSVLADGGDPIVVTTPHPHTGRTPWTNTVSGSYAIGKPAFTAEAAVVTADWLGNGKPVPASYRHLRANQAMRQAAIELGVPVIDAERYWFEAVAEHGENALFNTGEYAHPNLLGHQQSYWKAIDAFVRGLTSAPLSASTPPAVREVFAVKSSTTVHNNTSTLAADPHLKFVAGPNQTWLVDVDLGYTTPTAADLRIGLGFPAGTTGSFSVAGPGSTAAASNDVAVLRRGALTAGNYIPVGGNGADGTARVKATVRTGSTGGEVGIMTAQDVATASNTTIYTNSSLRATRIA